MPIRERYPELTETGLFDRMDAVYITGRQAVLDWESIVDGEHGTMLILPHVDRDGWRGVGCHFHSARVAIPRHPRRRLGEVEQLFQVVARALPVTMLAAVVATAA